MWGLLKIAGNCSYTLLEWSRINGFLEIGIQLDVDKVSRVHVGAGASTGRK